ncbi:MAG: hypothetical protein ACUVWZ_01630 [Anaerolineae bacterium]
MKIMGGSFREQVLWIVYQMIAAGLEPIERLLNVRWGEHLLERLTRRWQNHLDRVEHLIQVLEQERIRLQQQTEALAIYGAAIYLGSRSLIQNELRIDPANPREAEILDASVEVLVKRQLAAVSIEESREGRPVYHLEPDWTAIRARLSEAAKQGESQMAEWFREGVQLIDETFLQV